MKDRNSISKRELLRVLQDEVDNLFLSTLRGVERYIKMFDGDIETDPARAETWLDSYYRVIVGELDRNSYAILTVQFMARRLLGDGNPIDSPSTHYRTVLREMENEMRGHGFRVLNERLTLREAA